MVLVGFRVLGLACYVLSPHDGTAHRNHQNLSEPSEPQNPQALSWVLEGVKGSEGAEGFYGSDGLWRRWRGFVILEGSGGLNGSRFRKRFSRAPAFRGVPRLWVPKGSTFPPKGLRFLRVPRALILLACHRFRPGFGQVFRLPLTTPLEPSRTRGVL